MKKYYSILLCFAFLFAAEVFAQAYTVVKLPLSQEMIDDECKLRLLDNDETIIWACRAGAYRQDRTGTIEKVDFEDDELNASSTVWLTPHEYAYPIYQRSSQGEYITKLMRCDSECHDITPSNWLCNDVQLGSLKASSNGDVFYWCLYTNENNGKEYTAIYVISSAASNDVVTQSQIRYGYKYQPSYTSDFINRSQQLIVFYYAENSYGKLWDGTAFRALPKGAKENLWPLALFDDGRVVGLIQDNTWTPHVRAMTGRKVAEISFKTKAGQRLMRKGTYFEPIAKSADGSLLVRIYPKGMKKQFAIIKGTKIELTKIDPTINTMWKAGAVNDCGSAIGIQKPSTVFPNAETGLFLIRKAGC